MIEHLGADAAKICANWITGELASALNRDNLDITASPVSSHQLAWLIARIRDNTISSKAAKDVFWKMWKPGHRDLAKSPLPLRSQAGVDRSIDEMGLKQISDSGAIEKIVDEVLAANPKQIEDYRAGKEKAFNSLVGQVMKATKGKANPAQLNEILKRKLAG